jgi:uncharacterized protein (TIGR04255 family)
MPHYSKAPITEAIVDIRTEQPSALRFDDLQAVAKRLNEYTLAETRNLTQAVFQVGSPPQASAQERPWALVFRNGNNTQVLQVRLDGFTFSRLKPYEDFEHLTGEARKLWDIYREVASPKKITRVALRYINQFDFAGESIEPEDYLNTFPRVPEKLPAGFRDFGPFWMNLIMPQTDLNGTLVINEGNTPPRSPRTIPIVLDLDLFVENPPVASEQELWAFFEKLRERKNLYFEASITEKTRGLIR